jgi:arginine:ornithine antiporter/lysine permease
MARREQGKRVFTPAELGLFVVAVLGAIVGVVGLVQGWITI